jgi:hypothetical protein
MRFEELIEVIRNSPVVESHGLLFGVLLERLDPTDFSKIGLEYTYYLNSDVNDIAANAFREINGIIEKQLAQSMDRLRV